MVGLSVHFEAMRDNIVATRGIPADANEKLKGAVHTRRPKLASRNDTYIVGKQFYYKKMLAAIRSCSLQILYKNTICGAHKLRPTNDSREESKEIEPLELQKQSLFV